MRQGRWTDARALFESAIDIFRESTGTTELTMARSWLMMMAAHMQDMREVRRHRDWFRRHAADCGGTLLVLHLGLVDGYVQMLEGRFDEAYDTLTRAADLFDDDPPNAQRAALRLYRYGADIYRDDGRRARRELALELERARPFRFMSTMYAGTYGVIPALIEANALRAGDRGASSRRIDRLSAIIDAAPPLWAGGSSRARGYAADAEGRPEDAVLYLARAEEEAARFDRKVDAAIARWQRGRRLGGDYGAELCASAEELVRSLEVSPLLLQEDAGLR
jgi:tetratricopeptide (TPR) repeat protein